MKGVILDFDTIGPDDLDTSILLSLPISWQTYGNTSFNEVNERIRYADVVLTNKVELSNENIKQAANLKLIGLFATGTNIIDLEAASDKNICVSNAVAYCTDSVVQHVWALILALTTRIFDYSQAATDGRWERSNSFCVMDYSVKELAGKTLGVVGAGELGRAVASVGLAFGMNVKYALFPERHSFTHDNRLEFKVLLQQSDIVTLHCPLTKDNVNLIDKKELKLMKSTAILINTARGKLVNELSLRDALVKGEIGGAGLDVLSQEPPCEGNALLDDSLPNLIITPHTAWISLEARQRLIEQVAGTVGKFLKGEKINSVC